MDIESLIDHPDIVSAREKLQRMGIRGGRKLNPKCQRGDVFINVVLQGGGTLGIAHVGVLYALELLQVRIAGIAGTSAGAIAALLTSCARPKEPGVNYAMTILDVLSSMPAHEFIDGPYLIRRFIKELLQPRPNLAELPVPAWKALEQLFRTSGLNPGDAFQSWLEDTLRTRFNIESIADLRVHLALTLSKARDAYLRSAGLASGGSQHKPRSPINAPAFEGLQLIATGLPGGMKIVFPRRHDLFTLDTESASPAVFARASMSIPFFFQPVSLLLKEAQWDQHLHRLRSVYDSNELRRLKAIRSLRFIDGGVLSNFPIDAFEQRSATRNWLHDLPTIGFSMRASSTESLPEEAFAPRGLRALTGLCADMFSATRALRDREARAACAYPSGVAFIDTGEHNWLNFMLDEHSTRDLFWRGMQCVTELVESRP